MPHPPRLPFNTLTAFRAAADRQWMHLDYLNAADMTAFVEKQAAYYTDVAAKIGIRK